MVGKKVEFPLDHGIYEIGVIKQYCDTSGKLLVEDDEGGIWHGYEYQVVIQNEQG